uniref:PBPe domain-containing protein n=1 Tax=Globodera pallida TaxID=36090 RepID=A0A183BQI4_GLOPA
MIYDENANNSETSGENGASELRRRRNATKSESADDQRDSSNSRDEDNLLSELESERRHNSNTDQHIPNSDEEADRDSSSASSNANSDKGLDKVAGLIHSKTKRNNTRKRDAKFAIIYAFCHTLIILLQATTLNVAFNSHNQSLLTIMMSNNFIELKGAVFKKFGKPNLFQMSCSDAVNWKLEHLYEMAPDLIMIVFAEHAVDWLKHAFITKFNEISAFVYREYTVTIAYDILRTHEADSFSDFSDQITILLIRVSCQSVDFENPFSISAFVCVWLFLLFIKVFNGVSLYNKATDQVGQFRSAMNKEGRANSDDDESRRLFPSMFPL